MEQHITSENASDNLLLGQDPGSVSSVFAVDARNRNHTVIYMLHPGMNGNHDSNKFKLSLKHMEESENYLLRANKSIHRSWPVNDEEEEDCIRRDSFLVRWCDRVYAVGVFTDDASLLKISGDVAWACQIYVDRFMYDQEPLNTCELYFLDLKSEVWFKWQTQWTRINDPVSPHGIYAVVGHEKLTRSAKKTIDDIWN